MRTIQLEILRHGPPHNQLLSPLTEYLALCENHAAVTVRLPFEHAAFLLRLKALQYAKDVAYRPLELEDLARKMTDILSQVPGLIRELAEQSASANETCHLRLILSANELALLPFEITNASQGFAGAGQPLLLQSQAPICVTREVRRVVTEHLSWPPPPYPRILFAAAAPLASVPLEAHLLVFRQVIDPWVFHFKDEAERRKRIGDHLTVLPSATLREIEEECASGKYTHVHLLAHGVPIEKGDDRRYGLALHDPADRGRPDVVEASRLAKAMRPPIKNEAGKFARPSVVTLAVCDAGSVGSVVGAGASIAHSLHDEGIPFVVASQFPLSFGGSVVMTKVLYSGLLGGEDPRVLLINLRRELMTKVPGTHDWASIVAYASFPPDMDRELGRIQVDQAFRSLEAAINHVDKKLGASTEGKWNDDRRRLNAARDRIDRLLKKNQDPKVFGIAASADKRLAQILWQIRADPSRPAKDENEVRELLISAREYYEEAFRRDRSQMWARVQSLAMTAVLRCWQPNETLSAVKWRLAEAFSQEELRLEDRQRLAWANANLAELYLLSLAMKDAPLSAREARKKARAHASAFAQIPDLTWLEIHSTRRQFHRYSSFFSHVNPELAEMAREADRLTNLLPESSGNYA
jgi:hypothetical protein